MKWFSFEGRATRGEWWKINLLAYVACVIFILLIGSAEISRIGNTTVGNGPYGLQTNVLVALFCVFFVMLVWVGLAVGVRRYHDRNKSGWWLLIAFIPFIGPFWQFIELGCMEGVSTGNRYGGSDVSSEAQKPKAATVGDLMNNS